MARAGPAPSTTRARNKSRKVVECETLNFGVLNINGTKFNKAKWAALERDVLLGRKTKIMLLSETRLMNDKQCPTVEGYHFTFSNRLKYIIWAPRNERSKRFWKHVNRAKPGTGRRSKIRR